MSCGTVWKNRIIAETLKIRTVGCHHTWGIAVQDQKTLSELCPVQTTDGGNTSVVFQ